MANVFVKINNQKKGPLSTIQLENLVQRGQFHKTDYIYNSNSQSWVAADQAAEFKYLFQTDSRPQRSKSILAIAGGKGGVGKTVLASSLGIGLTAYDLDVLMVDADLGGANLHTCMGMLEPDSSMADLYLKRKCTLQQLAIPTPVDNLRLVSGVGGVLGAANLKYFQKLKIINELRRLDADYILLDLGAGASFNTLDFFMCADEGLLITTPETAAIQETFDFLKVAVLRHFSRKFKKNATVYDLLKRFFFNENGRMKQTLPQVVEQIKMQDSEAGFYLQSFLESYHPKFVLNMVRSSKDLKEADAFRTAVKELLGIQVQFVGSISYDADIQRSTRQLVPFLLNYPNSKSARNISKIVSNGLLQKNSWSHLHPHKRMMKTFIGQENSGTTFMPSAESICSIECPNWGHCQYQKGGHLCPLHRFDGLFGKYAT